MQGSKIARAVAGLVILILVLGSFLADRPEDKTSGTPAAGATDEAAIREAIETSLKDAAVAQESHRTANPSYTSDQAALEAEGLTLQPDVVFAVFSADENGYCMDAGNIEAQIFYYYYSEEGAPSEGSCAAVVPPTGETVGIRSQLEAVLKDMATAQESFRTANPRYTDRIKDLEREGLQISPGLKVSIELATKTAYCMEAQAEGQRYRYKSNRGAPEKGTCG